MIREPILAQERAAGFAEGRADADFTRRQMRQCEWDESFAQGRADGLADAPSRWPSFIAGLVLGAAAVWALAPVLS